MDSGFAGFSASLNGSKFKDTTLFPDSEQFQGTSNGFKVKDPSLDSNLNFVDSPPVLPDLDPGYIHLSSLTSTDGDSPTDDFDFTEVVPNYISQMLLEEDMEEKPCMFYDPLVLQAAEKSLYDVIGEKYPSSSNQSSSYGDQFLVDSPDDGFSSGFSDHSSLSGSSSNNNTAVDPQRNVEFGELKLSFLQTPLPTNFVFQSQGKSNSQPSLKLQKGLGTNGNGLVQPSVSEIVVPNLFSESELALQFKKGVEEATKFLPKSNQLVLDLETNAFMPESEECVLTVAVEPKKEASDYFPELLMGKKYHKREEEDFEEERSNKQSAICDDEIELSEMFDKVLVCVEEPTQPPACELDGCPESKSSNTMQQTGQTNGSSGSKTRVKRQANKKEVVDLRTLLILCAQAVSTDDRRTANELLKQIRQHSSPFGDGAQRLAHCFANGLEARLAGTGTQIYTALSEKKISAACMLKAYQAYLSDCPFKKLAIVFANHTFFSMAEKATTLHIIDFGILYGFQWPPLIYRLAKRPGGPPKLRITGIDLPQSGFRPAKGVQETGHRLAKYCERHNVPFEFNAIAQKWETIRIDDLKINPGEFLGVNCLFRFKNLLDETVVIDSPRDAVLNLIRNIKPDIFVHAIVNGSYSAPFFVTRFREALFHFSALFDMLDMNMRCEDEMRLKFEKEFYSREAMNVIACEGTERVERPEIYKQWQVRNVRAGLKQLPLDNFILKKLKHKVSTRYHADFVVDQDGHWLLQGWKGRIVYASSAWIPT
uniref:GRAS03 protein n=1 Tax=Rhizophora mucronata TaxID=61149 RepID=A0A2P2IYL8_RHIMU